MRITKQRQKVLNIFENSNALLCAEEVSKRLADESIDLSTIYRSLDYLTTVGLLGKSTIEQVSFYYATKGDHHHYMICTNCKSRLPLDCHLEKVMKKTLRESKFKVMHHDMTVYGLCYECQLDRYLKPPQT